MFNKMFIFKTLLLCTLIAFLTTGCFKKQAPTTEQPAANETTSVEQMQQEQPVANTAAEDAMTTEQEKVSVENKEKAE